MMIDLISKFLIASGLFFFLVGTVGILRFPDALTRAHGAAKADTLGAVLCIFGLVLQAGFSPVTLKLIVIICFLWTASPTATHMIAGAIYNKDYEED